MKDLTRWNLLPAARAGCVSGSVNNNLVLGNISPSVPYNAKMNFAVHESTYSCNGTMPRLRPCIVCFERDNIVSVGNPILDVISPDTPDGADAAIFLNCCM